MISKYLSLFMLFVLTTFSITFANAKPTIGQTYSGSASYYGARHHGNKTASGERFNMYGLTAAHRSLPLGCKIRVTNPSNGKSVILKVNDRGPFHGNRILDVSQGAAKQLGFIKQGLAKIDIEVLSIPESKKVTHVKRTNINSAVDRNYNKRRISDDPEYDAITSLTNSITRGSLPGIPGTSFQPDSGSTNSSSISSGLSFYSYQDSTDSISRLIASGYGAPTDGESSPLPR